LKIPIFEIWNDKIENFIFEIWNENLCLKFEKMATWLVGNMKKN
jgi:hypothetical protein